MILPKRLTILWGMAMDDLMKIRAGAAYDVPNRKGLKSSYQWHPGMKDDIILRVSKSSLGAFKFCSQQYFIKYPLRVREPANDDMTRGSNVHDAVEEFYNTVSVAYAASMKSYGIEYVLQYFNEFIPSEDPKRGLYTLGEEEHLRKYMYVEAQRFMDCDDPQFFLPIANEVTLDAVIEIEGVLVHLTGIVDRMFADEEGRCHIHELKTGVWKDKAQKWQSMREEMAYYVYLLQLTDHETLGGLNAEYWGWDHTGGESIFRGREPVIGKPVEKMMDSLRSLVKTHKMYKGDNNGKYFPLINDFSAKYICEPWCRVKGFCPRYDKVLWPYGEEE